MQSKQSRSVPPSWIFFRRWLANPLSMGSVVASGAALGRLVVGQLDHGPEKHVIELGGGTGSLIQTITDSGFPAEQLCSIEIEPELAAFLRKKYPSIRVVEGDASSCDQLLGDELKGRVGTVIVGIPMLLLPLEQQQRIINAIFRLAPSGHRFLLYSYWPTSPLPARKLGLIGRRVGFTWRNFPPVSLWEYRRI